MIYKILIKNKLTSTTFSYYQVQVGTQMVDFETEYIQELIKTYKALLAQYTTEQIKLVHELEPEIIINLEEETNSSTEDVTPDDEEDV